MSEENNDTNAKITEIVEDTEVAEVDAPPEPIIKAKKPRSEKQKAALLKAQETRRKNQIEKKETAAKIQKEATKIVKKKTAKVKAKAKKAKKKVEVVLSSSSDSDSSYSSESSSSSSSSSGSDVIVVKRKAKKVKVERVKNEVVHRKDTPPPQNNLAFF